MQPTIRARTWIRDAALLLIGATVLVSAVFLTTPVTGYQQGFDSDGRFYGTMAGETAFSPALAHMAPWCYRILTPYLASRLPWDVLVNFRVLAFISNWLSLLMLFLVLRELNFSHEIAAIGGLLYSGGFWTLKFSFYSPAYIDYQTQLLLLIIIYLTVSRSFLLLIPVFILGALQKESLAVLGLFSVACLVRQSKQPRFRTITFYSLSFLCASVGTLYLVRQWIPAYRHPPQFNVLLSELRGMLRPDFGPILLQSLFSGLGIIPVLLVIHYRPWLDFLRHRWEWLVYAAISLGFIFCGHDKARLFLYSLPLAVILVLHTVGVLRQGRSALKFRIWIAVCMLAHFLIGNYLSPIGSFPDYLAKMVPVHAGGRFLPFLLRNGVLGVVIFIFSIQFMIGEWYFRPSVGFTRRQSGLGNHSGLPPLV